jgi:hypothetical protein
MAATIARVKRFERAAHDLLAQHETAPSRVISLAETRKQVGILNLKQTELLEESLKAMEGMLYRPAIVMAWAAFMDFLQERLAESQMAPLHAHYPKWSKWATLDDLRENVTEFAMLDASRKLGLLTKAELKALQGLLSQRNECAHPSGYKPGLNEALGYVSQLLNRIVEIDKRKARMP